MRKLGARLQASTQTCDKGENIVSVSQIDGHKGNGSLLANGARIGDGGLKMLRFGLSFAETPAVSGVSLSCVVARIGAERAKGAKIGEGGRNALRLFGGGNVGLLVLAGSRVTGLVSFAGKSSDPRSSSTV